MKFYILPTLLLASYTLAAESKGKIKLEDIERDNLLSERRLKAGESLEAQQTQHIRPPAIHAANAYQVQHETRASDHQLGGGVTYARPTAADYEQDTVQYVTVSQPNYPGPTYVPQVHEAERTYSAPSRHSLIAQQQQQQQAVTAAPIRSFATHPQPQYVYVQAGPQHQDITYATAAAAAADQQQAQQFIQYVPSQPTHAPAYVMIPYAMPAAYVAPRVAAVQYAAALAQRQQQQQQQQQQHHQIASHLGQIPDYARPSSASAGPIAPIKYVSSTPSSLLPSPSPQPTIAAVIEPSSAITYAKSVPAPVQYVAPSELDGFQYQQYAQNMAYVQPSKVLPLTNEVTPSVSYAAGPQFIHPNVDYFRQQQFTPILDFFGYQNKHASLLDSYIPSSLIYAKSKSLFQEPNNNFVHFNVGPHQQGFQQQSLYHPQQQQLQQQQAAYNTIAFSTDQGYGHAKRSPSSQKSKA